MWLPGQTLEQECCHCHGLFINGCTGSGSQSPVGNMSALVQVKAWCRTGSKPLRLLGAIMTQFPDVYASMGFN